MCGRFTRSGPVQEVAKLFELDEPPAELAPRYNIAPSQVVAVVGLKPDGKRRGLAMLKWGFVPSWSKDPNPKVKPINARAETVLSKPLFREAFEVKRCLIPADGFYEWSKTTPRTPFYIKLRSGGLFAFAGLWDVWKGGGQALGTCCIITTAANSLVRPLHERMPAIIEPEKYTAWLDTATSTEELMAMLRPMPAEQMEMVKVGTVVNSPRNDRPECLIPTA